ncbi:MAG: hypothetical protein QXF40_05950 [Metallosphaera sp.]
MEKAKLTDIFREDIIRLIFFVTFIAYFVFYQFADRLLLFGDVSLPQGVNVVLSTSPPVPPSQMPFPLWGPFISITTSYFDWAITPLSLGISFILSFLVSLNVSLYIALFRVIRAGSKHKLAASLGMLATSLSCSCELFTALIGATVSNLPFLVSIAFMNLLGETLTLVAGTILTISSLVISSEITGTNPFSFIKWTHGIPLAVTFSLLLLFIPRSNEFLMVSVVDAILAGGIWGYVVLKKVKVNPNKYYFLASISLTFLELVFFPYLNFTLLDIISLAAGFLGYIGYISLKPWVRLGILHVIGWTLIMPGPISLISGTPIPFYNITGDQAVLLWITSWIFGTPIAWLAGIQYLHYIRDKMSDYTIARIPLRTTGNLGLKGFIWILLGGIAVISQVLFFITHSQYFLYNNGYDMIFLEVMTLSSTLLITAGLALIGYGFYSIIKSRFVIPKVNKKYFIVAALIYGLAEALLTKMIIIAPTGYPYPPVLLLNYGEPMYAPAVTIYLQGVIGLYLYPASIVTLIASSVLSGAIWSLLMRTRRTKLGSITTFGLLAACPSCGLSGMAYALSYIGSLSSLLLSFYTQLAFTLLSVTLLTLLFLYSLRKASSLCDVDLKLYKKE